MVRAAAVVIVVIGLVGCSLDDECGPTPIDGCSEAECVTNPSDPAYGSCGGYLYSCVHGGWERSGYCEPARLRVTGRWELQQELRVASGECLSTLTPRDAFVLDAAGGPLYDVTSTTAQPMVDEALVVEGFRETNASVMLSDLWLDGAGEVSAYLEYSLTFDWNESITGTAEGQAGACYVEVSVTGVLRRE